MLLIILVDGCLLTKFSYITKQWNQDITWVGVLFFLNQLIAVLKASNPLSFHTILFYFLFMFTSFNEVLGRSWWFCKNDYYLGGILSWLKGWVDGFRRITGDWRWVAEKSSLIINYISLIHLYLISANIILF